MSEEYNAAERQHVRQASRVARIIERQQTEFITHIMDTIPGRAWVFGLLEAAHVFATSHTGNALNTAFAEGERNIGLVILNDIMRACPDQYVVMMREANGRRTSADTNRKPATSAVSLPAPADAEPADSADDDGSEAADIYTEYDRSITIEQRGPEGSA